MSATPDRLADAHWLAADGVREIFGLLAVPGDETRVVGGAVRNSLLGLPVGDIDFATTLTPDRVVALAEAAGVKAVPTGFEHGTVTLIVGGRGFEVTTLREDIETDGRRAIVRFGRDWTADALRRDFTVNALSADSAGKLYDPARGYPDIAARRIRFIGDAAIRIAEDRLRILRFFRFHAAYGEGAIDPAGLAASIRARNGLRDLSAERIGQEMRKLVVARRAPETLSTMQDVGVLGLAVGGVGYVGQFARGVAFEESLGLKPAPARRLGLLAARIAEDVSRLTARMRLSNAERERILAMLAAFPAASRPPGPKAARRLLYECGIDGYRDAVVYGAAWDGVGDEDAWRDRFALPERWSAPKFPIGGRDLTADGIRGPAVGEILRSLEAWWVDQDFTPDKSALRARLQQMMAAAQ
jgi:tRNA nucleotidyltransferase/poly(A) polymerase